MLRSVGAFSAMLCDPYLCLEISKVDALGRLSDLGRFLFVLLERHTCLQS